MVEVWRRRRLRNLIFVGISTAVLYSLAQVYNGHIKFSEQVLVSDYFVLRNFGYSESCGGCSVLHLLLHLMNPKSHPIAYLSDEGDACRTNPGYMTPIMPSWLNKSSSIAIYNEFPENLFNARRRIYYVLFFPANGVTYPKDSYILCWSDGFCDGIDNSMKKFTLNLLQLDMELFDSIQKTSSQERNTSYILVKKNTWMVSGNMVNLHDDVDASLGKSFPIDKNKLDRLKLLANAERLVSYDRATFISVEAAAMGCLSIVMPAPNVTRDGWLRSVGDSFKYGIAYGFDEVEYALSTMDQVNDHLKRLASTQEGNVREFVRDALAFFSTSVID